MMLWKLQIERGHTAHTQEAKASWRREASGTPPLPGLRRSAAVGGVEHAPLLPGSSGLSPDPEKKAESAQRDGTHDGLRA